MPIRPTQTTVGMASQYVNVNYRISSHPLYFVRSGHIDKLRQFWDAGDVILLASKRASDIIRSNVPRYTNTLSNIDYASHARWGTVSLCCYMLILFTSPFYFSRGGDINLSTGSQRVINYYGNYWSGTTASVRINVYYFSFNRSGIYPSSSNSRWNGFSVARTSLLDIWPLPPQNRLI